LGDAASKDTTVEPTRRYWQTTGTQQTDAFTARVRRAGTVWTTVGLNAQIATGVDGRIVHSATFADLNFDDDYDYEITHLRGGS
jgi:hypothetical protein